MIDQKLLGHGDAVIGHETTDMTTRGTFGLFGHFVPTHFVGLDVGTALSVGFGSEIPVDRKVYGQQSPFNRVPQPAESKLCPR